MDYSFWIWRIANFISKTVRIAALETNQPKIAEIIRTSICDFQADYTNLQFKASRDHREFRIEYDKNPNSDETEQAFDRFERAMANLVKVVCANLVENIQKYFQLTHFHHTKPRVGILVMDSDDYLKSVYLSENKGTLSKKMEEYSEFIKIKKTGLPYMVNHLPRKVIRDPEYVHKGLDVVKIRKTYSLKFSDRKLISRIKKNHFGTFITDEKWKAMSSVQSNEYEHFYKSMMNIPITFRYHAKKARIHHSLAEILDIPENGRAILGFLCIDHPSTFYFDNSFINDDNTVSSLNNVDINFMYPFADLISFVLITRLMYTTGSGTYKEYINLKNNGK